MEQLTPQEWLGHQLKRMPSFAVAFGMFGTFLFISTFITYGSVKLERDLMPLAAEIEAEQPPKIEDIKEKKLVQTPPSVKPAPSDAPLVTDEEVSSIDAPIDPTRGDVDVEVTEDASSTNTTVTDPIPMDLTKRMAVISTDSGSGGFRGALGPRSGAGRRSARGRYGRGPAGKPPVVSVQATDNAILDALRWLKSVQEPDGSWSCSKWGGEKDVPANMGVTGLALLAFLGNGCTDREPQEFAPTVRKAIDNLMNVQSPDGSFGSQYAGSENELVARFYAHGICTLAMCEAYAMMQNPKFKATAEKALRFTFAVQNPNGGFGYNGQLDGRGGGDSNTTDVSVTAFQIQSLKAARTGKLEIPPEVIARIESYLRTIVNSDSSTSYRYNIGNMSPHESGTFSMTAASLAARLLWWGSGTPANDAEAQAKAQAEAQAKYLTTGKELPAIAKGERSGRSATERNYDIYTIYYTSLAMFHMGGKYWSSWRDVSYNLLLARQAKSGPDRGSWPTNGTQWGDRGGRVFTTAFGALALEAYCRYE